MYPLALVHDTVRIYQSAFSAFAKTFNARVISLLYRNNRTDALKGLLLLEHAVADGAIGSVHVDADIFTWLQELRNEYGDDIPKEKFQKQLAMNAHTVNAFSRSQFKKTIESGRNSLRRGAGSSSQPHTIPVVDFTRGDNVAQEKVTGFIKENVGLIDNLSRAHANEVIDAVRDGVIHGKSLRQITEQITARTTENENRAAFWAEDQVGNLFGDLTKERQLSAGAPGYIWRTLKDSHVRDKHEHLEGMYHRWDKPPMSGSSDRRLYCHPGQDYRCRCYAEMAWGPHEAERELNPDRLAIQFQQNRINKQ